MTTAIKQGLTPEKFWVKDIDSNVLKTYRVGKYLITENLKTEHYNDGTPIPIIEDAEEWKKDTSGAMCYYDNDRKHKEECGALYNSYAVNTGKLAPKGWRKISDDDWKQIEMALGMSREDADKDECWRGDNIGNKMKEVLDVKFSGYHYPSGGGFINFGAEAVWWSSSVSGTGSWDRVLNTGYTSVARSVTVRSNGFSVRCVRELTEEEIRLLDNWTISEEKGNNIEKPQRDEKGRFVKQNKKINMEEKKLQETAEPERLSIKERICLKLILLAIKMLRPLSFESQEIEEIKKML